MAARRYGRRLRRGAAGTAVAAAAMAALSASQAPGFLPVAHASTHGSQSVVTPPPGPEIDGGSPLYVTALPPLNTPTAPADPTAGAPGGDPVISVPAGGASLPATVFDAYQRAQQVVAETNPGCHLPWELLAAIGQVESGQARGGAVDANGTTYSPILGPVLNGNGFADISDTDGGAYDGDPVHDRAVGPMQFIPSTWATWGADGNGDGVRDPNNIYDAALAAAHYLCADGRDLAVPSDMDRAILGYNHSQAYLDLVKSWYEHFRQGGAVAVPDRAGTPGSGVSASPSAPNPSTSPSPSTSPRPTATATGTVKPTQGSTPKPTTSPTGAPVTEPTTDAPTGPATTDPTTGTPTDPTTTPGCPTDPTPTQTPTPTDSGEVIQPPTATEPPADDTADAKAEDPTAQGPTPDPCGTDTDAADPSGTPSPTDTAGAAAGPAITNEP